MTDMSTTHKNELVNHIFRTTGFTQPTVMAVALLTTPAVDGDTAVFTSGTGVEVTNANAYARQDITSVDAAWDAPVDGLTANAALITFPTATGDWTTVDSIGLVDNITHNTGALFYHTTVASSKQITTDDIAQFAIGAITVQYD